MNAKNKLISLAILTVTLTAAYAAIAEMHQPVVDVGNRHPNLKEAQEHLRMAYDKLAEAQRANEWDMDGHAQKAKELMDAADAQIKKAAEAANHHEK